MTVHISISSSLEHKFEPSALTEGTEKITHLALFAAVHSDAVWASHDED